MKKAYRITYKFEGKEYQSVWYASEANKAQALFEMWHTGCEVIDVEAVNK